MERAIEDEDEDARHGDALRAGLESLSCEIIRWSDMDLPRGAFLTALTTVIAEHSGLARAELCLRENGKCECAQTDARDSEKLRVEGRPGFCGRCTLEGGRAIERLCRAMLDGRLGSEDETWPRPASISLRGAAPRMTLSGGKPKRRLDVAVDLGPSTETALLVPLAPESSISGLLLIRSGDGEALTDEAARYYESVAQLVSVAIAHDGSRRALRTRLSELGNLYAIAEVLAWPRSRAQEIELRVPELVARGCPLPGTVSARLVIDDEIDVWWPAPPPETSLVVADAVITVRGVRRGLLEVACDDGPLDGARGDAEHFVTAVARALSTLLHRWALHDERDRLQAQVHHAERLATLGTLASGLAHDLNEPLGAIFGFAELLSQQPELSAASREDLAKILSASRHLHGVVRRLLAFARTSRPSWRQVSLAEIVEDALCVVELRCLREGVRLVRKMADDAGTLIADPEQLCHVVVNLAVNAIDAMPHGGELLVETRGDDDVVRIVVADTGVGMSDEVARKVFEPFFTTKERGRGLGLGLSVVDGIVRAHQGSVTIASRPGRGTRFEVVLPRAGGSDA